MKELKTEPIQIMLTPTQKRKIKEYAEKRNMDMSSYIRFCALSDNLKIK